MRQKHGYVCLFLPADDLTICMDILPNPGPVSPISSPRNDSVYKLGGKNLHVRPNHIQYSRSALLKLRPCGNHVSNLGWNTLSNLKETSLLKYRGYRAGRDRNSVNNFAINSALKSQLFRSSIPIVSSRRVAFKRNSFEYRTKSLITIDCKTNNSVVQSLQTTGTGKVISRKPASIALINAQSIRNKTLPIKDYVVEHNLDILALTETWLNPDNSDDQIIGDFIPAGYSFLHIPRETRGGAVGLLFKNEFNAKQSTENRNTIYRSFEFLEISLQSSSHSLLIVVYRPGSSNGNKLSPEFFCEEFCNLLEHYTTDLSKLLIVGDFNFHVDDKGTKAHLIFLNCLRYLTLLDMYQSRHIAPVTHWTF